MNGRVVVRNFEEGMAVFPVVGIAAGKGAHASAAVISAPWDVLVEPLTEVPAAEDAEPDTMGPIARQPWSSRVTVSDHGPATHGLHSFTVELTESAAGGEASEASAPSEPDEPALVDVAPVVMTVSMRSERGPSYATDKPGSGPGLLDCPRGCVVLDGARAEAGGGGGSHTLVVDCQNNSLVLLAPGAPAV